MGHMKLRHPSQAPGSGARRLLNAKHFGEAMSEHADYLETEARTRVLTADELAVLRFTEELEERAMELAQIELETATGNVWLPIGVAS